MRLTEYQQRAILALAERGPGGVLDAFARPFGAPTARRLRDLGLVTLDTGTRTTYVAPSFGRRSRLRTDADGGVTLTDAGWQAAHALGFDAAASWRTYAAKQDRLAEVWSTRSGTTAASEVDSFRRKAQHARDLAARFARTENPMARTNPAPNLGLIGLIQSIHYGPPELTLSDLDDIDIWINAWRDGSGDDEAWFNVEEQVEAVRHDLNELIGAGAAYEVEYVGTGRGAQKIETDDASEQWLAEAEDGIARIEDAYEYDLEDID